jgi:hypothetical protein
MPYKFEKTKGHIPAPQIMLEVKLWAISHLKSSMARKLPPTPSNILNPRPNKPATMDSPRKFIDVGMVRPSSPPRGCSTSSSVEGNSFSQSRNWPIGFDHKGEIVVWEEDVDIWDVSPLDWALEDAFGDEALAIRDAMEEEFQRDKMISRQKSKGKRELA